MKIGELAKKSGVPKETIHSYIRCGLLRKPHKCGVNQASYTENHLEQLLLIKDLRENFFLPISEIKEILKGRKKQTPSEREVSTFRSKYFRPMDQLAPQEVVGRENLSEATGMGMKWILKMEEWGVLTPRFRGEDPVYTRDDVVLSRLMVDVDRLGYGPNDGYDPEDLRQITDFIRSFVDSGQNKYLAVDAEKTAGRDVWEVKSRITEVMSLFFYHSYRKLVRQNYERLSEEQQDKSEE